MQSSNISGVGNIVFIKIKIKCPAGQNLEIMIFRCLKTLDFDKFFRELQHYEMFLFLSIPLSRPSLLYDYSTLSPKYSCYMNATVP